MANTQANLVASFDAGIFTVSAQPVGVCIKFKLMYGEETLTHWPLMHFSKLIRIFEEYINHGRHQNFMFTVKQNSQLEEALDKRHPYFTLTDDVPSLNEEEVGSSSTATRVESCEAADKGSVLAIRPVINGGKIELLMHEYTAFSLYGYLEEMWEIYGSLTSTPTSNPQ